MSTEFPSNRRHTAGRGAKKPSPVRTIGRWLGLALLVVLAASGLAAGWIVYVANSNGSAKASLNESPAPAQASQISPQQPSSASTGSAPEAKPQPSAPQPTSTASLNSAPKTKPETAATPEPSPAAASGPPPVMPQPMQGGAGPGLVFCYQGKVPDSRLLVVDKSRQRLVVLRYLGEMTIEYEYPCATGMQPGNKETSGDERTPVGIYFTTHRFEDRKITIFGDRAIHLDYPNAFDQCKDRDGHGIFIHGTDKNLKPRSSNGCVVLRNDDLAVLAQLIKEQFTPVIVVEKLVLPTPEDRVKACDFLQRLPLATLEKAEARLGPQLATPSQLPSPAVLKELDAMAPRLAGFDLKDNKLEIQTNGLAVFGLGDNWVVLVDQRVRGPKREEVQVARRFYLSGADLATASLVQGQWVVADVQQARQLASWAPPAPTPPPAPVAVAAKPPAEPVQVASLAPAASAQPAPAATSPAPPKAAPPTPSQPPAAKAATPEDQLRAMLGHWIKAWETKNVNAYIAHYASDFKSQGMDRQAWKQHKTYLNNVYKVIGVEAKDVRVEIVGTKARVHFVQHYRSDWHRDVGRKTLDLVLRGGHWQITGERWEAMPGRAASSAPSRS